MVTARFLDYKDFSDVANLAKEHYPEEIKFNYAQLLFVNLILKNLNVGLFGGGKLVGFMLAFNYPFTRNWVLAEVLIIPEYTRYLHKLIKLYSDFGKPGDTLEWDCMAHTYRLIKHVGNMYGCRIISDSPINPPLKGILVRKIKIKKERPGTITLASDKN